MNCEKLSRKTITFPISGEVPRSRMGLVGSDDLISIGAILHAYKAPISEDHAWAFCCEIASALTKGGKLCPTYFWCKEMVDIDSIMIDGQGEIHVEVIPGNYEDAVASGPKILIPEQKLMTQIAEIIYHSLDFGLGEDEERMLEYELECLLTRMSGEEKLMTFQEVLEECEVYLEKNVEVEELNGNAGSISRKILRELVVDTLEFSKFLRIADRTTRALESMNWGGQQIKTYDEYQEKDDKLPYIFEKTRYDNFKTMAHQWIRVVKEFRSCHIVLKRLDESEVNNKEFGKTPYELLMDDIRTRRYNLKKVPDALVAKSTTGPPSLHDIVMEYIRSKPTLKKVAERSLKPLDVKLNAFEELMKSIKQVRLDQYLKPVRVRKSEAF